MTTFRRRFARRATAAVSPDRLIRATVIATAALLGLVGFTLFTTTSTNSAVKASEMTDAIRTCQALYRSPVDDATDRLEATRVRRDDIVAAGLVAAVAGDDEELLDIFAVTDEVRVAALEALEARELARADYREALTASRTDPEVFLEDCRRRFGT